MNDLERSEILRYLESTERKLLAELEGFDLDFIPPDGGWSAGQVLAHLVKTERYLSPVFLFLPKLARFPFIVRGLDRLNTALCRLSGIKFVDLGEKLPENLRQFTPRFRGKFVAPSFLRPREAGHDLKTLASERGKIRGRILDAVRRADLSKLEGFRFSHPIFGPFTYLEGVLFLGKHEEWHTEQIKRIKSHHRQQIETSAREQVRQ